MSLGVLKQKKGCTTLTYLHSSKWQQGATLRHSYSSLIDSLIWFVLFLHITTRNLAQLHFQGEPRSQKKTPFHLHSENHFLWKISRL